MERNETSPVVYGSVDDHLVTFRLSDGSAWSFSRREVAAMGHPKWAYLKAPDQRVTSARLEELELLVKVEREALIGERYAEL